MQLASRDGFGVARAAKNMKLLLTRTRGLVARKLLYTLAEDAKEYLEQPRLEHILREWCDHIAFPVRLNGRRINSEDALWRA